MRDQEVSRSSVATPPVGLGQGFGGLPTLPLAGAAGAATVGQPAAEAGAAPEAAPPAGSGESSSGFSQGSWVERPNDELQAIIRQPYDPVLEALPAFEDRLMRAVAVLDACGQGVPEQAFRCTIIYARYAIEVAGMMKPTSVAAPGRSGEPVPVEELAAPVKTGSPVVATAPVTAGRRIGWCPKRRGRHHRLADGRRAPDGGARCCDCGAPGVWRCYAPPGQDQRQGVVQVRLQIKGPILDDGGYDADRWRQEFERLCRMASESQGMLGSEQLVTLDSCLKRSRFEIYENINRRTERTGEIGEGPGKIYQEIMMRLAAFKEMVMRKQTRLNKQRAADTPEGNLTAQQFQPVVVKLITELDLAGIGKSEREKFLGYMRRVGPALSKDILKWRGPPAMDEFHAPNTWEEACKVVIEIESV